MHILIHAACFRHTHTLLFLLFVCAESVQVDEDGSLLLIDKYADVWTAGMTVALMIYAVGVVVTTTHTHTVVVPYRQRMVKCPLASHWPDTDTLTSCLLAAAPDASAPGGYRLASKPIAHMGATR
jgi:hypothetical protein